MELCCFWGSLTRYTLATPWGGVVMGERQVAIVTGASRGIGTATAQAFGRAGYDVVLTARTEAGLNRVAEEVRGFGADALVVAGDLADLGFAESVVQRAAEHFGRIDVLVNNAATNEKSSMRTATVADWEEVLRVNLTAPAFLAKWAAEQMERTGHGVIINISSIEAIHPTGQATAYVAAKGGLDSLTYGLANLYGPVGIRVVGLRLGAIDTEMSRDWTDAEGRDLTKALQEVSTDRTPLGRWGQPQEIADTILWLAGPGAAYITGTNIVVDGGWTRNRVGYSLQKRFFPDESR